MGPSDSPESQVVANGKLRTSRYVKQECTGNFEKVSLGYDFETDILEIDFYDVFDQSSFSEGYLESLMYSIIEGMSTALEIDRNDIDGTIYVNRDLKRSIILFDTVPGGAGHVKRMLQPDNFIYSLNQARDIVENCSCGADQKDTSCYSCLRNYYNQYCHENLRRDYAIEALNHILEIDKAATRQIAVTVDLE